MNSAINIILTGAFKICMNPATQPVVLLTIINECRKLKFSVFIAITYNELEFAVTLVKLVSITDLLTNSVVKTTSHRNSHHGCSQILNHEVSTIP